MIDFSSQYSTSNWSAAQALGEPNTFTYGDRTTAWASSSSNGTTEYITLGFDIPVYATGVTVRETWGNGFVRMIEVLDIDNNYTQVWQGIDPSQPGSPVDFRVNFAQTSFLVEGVRVTIDTNHNLSTWEEIDAVQLHSDLGNGGTLQFSDATFDTLGLT